MTAVLSGELLCAADPDEFTDHKAFEVSRLRRICANCEALLACRSYSLSNDVAGFAGGLTERERHAIQNRHPASVVDDIDQVAIERRLAGDRRVRLNRAELDVAMRVGVARFGNKSAAAAALGINGSTAKTWAGVDVVDRQMPVSA